MNYESEKSPTCPHGFPAHLHAECAKCHTIEKERKDTENERDPLLNETIYNEKEKKRREEDFEKVWHIGWHPEKGGSKAYFQSSEQESPFAEFSSKGWKIHIALKKGKEKEISRLLYENGLYFKVEAGSGTYFNGLKESGSTIYVGSRDNMQKIAEIIQEQARDILEEGIVAEVGNRKVPIGSGSDEEVAPKITARFDVAKTEFGWLEGNGKYAEHGLPSWMELGGTPILKKYEKEVADIITKWNKYTPYQREVYFERKLKPIQEESRKELINDFGSEFLLGKEQSSQD